MKKIINRIIVYLLCAMLAASVITLSGCGVKDNSVSENISSSESVADTDKHFAETGAYIVKNGSCDYKIVMPNKSTSVLEFAVSELQTFFAEATGINLAAVKDNNLVFGASSKYISIGETSVFRQVKISAPEDLGHSGACIMTVEKSVFMFGETDYGSLYAVYDFLAEMFGFEYYGDECYSLDKNVDTLPLYNMNYTDIPDIQYRMSTSGRDSYNSVETYRFREEYYYTSVLTQINTIPWHNSLEYVAGAVEGHEAYWYSAEGTQLCYTAHGDAEEYELLQQACLDKLIEQVIAYPDRNAASLTISDAYTFCSCDACKKVIAKYGTNSSLCLLFCNDLRGRLAEWFDSEEGAPHKRDFTLYFFAYMCTTDAPVSFNSQTGKCEMIDGLKCADGVSVMYAPIDYDFTKPFDSEINIQYTKAFEGWDLIADDIYFWSYNWGFRSYFAPYDTFDNLQALYQMCAKTNIKCIYNEGGHYMKEGGSCWEMLKMYLCSKLAWDCNADVAALIDNFFDYYYGPVSDEIQSVYTSFRIHSSYLEETDSTYGGTQSCQKSYYDRKWWPKQLLLSWEEQFQKAYNKLDILKTSNPEAYETYYKRVALEDLSPLYLLIYLYSGELGSNDLADYRTRFKSYVETLGITKGDYGDSIKDTYSRLGIK